MDRRDILPERDNLPLENVKIKGKRRFKPVVVCIVLLLCLSFLAGGFFIRRFCFSGAVNASAQFAAIATFGLAPTDAGTAELLSENIVFNESEIGDFNVTMTYHVNLLEKTSFLLPYAHLEQYQNPEIYIDGKPIDFTSEKLSSVVTRPIVFQGAKLQSVGFSNSYLDLQESQPLDSYRLLMDSLNSYGGKIHILSLNSKLKVFDVSHAKEEGEEGKIRFEVEGDFDTIRLMFTDGDYEYSQQINEVKDGNAFTEYSFRALSVRSNKKWFAVPQDSEVRVSVGGEPVSPEILELETILTPKLGLNQETQRDYLKTLNQSLEETGVEGKVFVADPDLTTENALSVKGGPFANLYYFDVEDAGTHEITLKLTATGSSFNHMLEWADSPSDMWRKTGERKLYIHLQEKPYQYLYQITDNLIHFEEFRTNE